MVRFSIIIPTYNSEHYIEQCLNSLIKQTFMDFEIIIVDDFSTDNTKKIIKKIKNQHQNLKINFFTNNKNMGVSYTRNKAMSKSVGEFIVILDSDDYFLDNRLEVLDNYLNSNTDIDIIFDNLLYLETGKDTYHTDAYYEKELKINRITKLDMETYISYDLGYLKGVIKREKIMDNNITFNETIKIGEDFLFYIDCFLNNADIYLIPESLYVYRQNPDSLSHTITEENFIHRINSTQSIIESKELKSKKIKEKLIDRLNIQKKQYQYFKFTNFLKKKEYIKAVSYMLKNPRILTSVWKKMIKSI